MSRELPLSNVTLVISIRLPNCLTSAELIAVETIPLAGEWH